MNRAMIAENFETIILLDGFDDCIINIIGNIQTECALYSTHKIIEKLKKEMSEEEAREYFEYNIIGAYLGEHTPMFTVEMDCL